jgi:predicted heme/steroid binding protein/uncharacterized membrane protein
LTRKRILSEKPLKISLEDLQDCDGSAGKPTYLVYQGKVFDVSGSKLWPGGHHMNTHLAGRDLTDEINAAPHGPEVLERYPQVGVLDSPATGRAGVPAFLARLLRRYPLLKRHPHPMIVHFPIAFMIAAPAFTLLYLLTQRQSFEPTAFYCLVGGVLFTPLAMLTGLFTWWLNYLAEPVHPVIMKLILSPILLALGSAACLWRWLEPDILTAGWWWGKVAYLILVLALAPVVAAIGAYGGSLTFPTARD